MNNDNQPLIEHLLELRKRIVWTLIGIVLGFGVLVPFSQELYSFIAQPLLNSMPTGTSMIAIDVVTPFFVPMKVTLMLAFLLTLPHTLYQIWAFIAPALYQHEKRLIAPLVLSSFTLFIIGMAFCYFVVLPLAFGFFTSITPEGVNMATDIDRYLSFILTLFVAFGLTFEIPIAIVLLNRMGAISIQQLKTARPYVVVCAFILGAILTPPDVISQILLALPMLLLYEGGLFTCTLFEKNKKNT